MNVDGSTENNIETGDTENFENAKILEEFNEQDGLISVSNKEQINMLKETLST